MEVTTPGSRHAPPISSLLTVIITTSPTPSAPTTDLISSILESFRVHCPDLAQVSVIVTFDTYDHIGPKNRLKRGTVTEEGARIFDQYKANVKDLILTSYAPSPSPHDFITHTGQAEYGLAEQPVYTVPYTVTQTRDGKVTFIEPAQRLGFGLSVRTALRLAPTPYVWVHQHDWTLVSDIPLSALLAVMASSTSNPTTTLTPREDTASRPPVQYVCFPSVRMLRYHVSDHVTHFPALRALTKQLKRDFVVSSPASPSSGSSTTESVCLTPLFFWHDKPHLASREHYLDRIFPGRLAIGRGEFIEDRVGQRARDQMKQGVWARWGCWLFYPDEGRRLVVRHLNGRIWRGEEGDRRRKEMARSGEVTPEVFGAGEVTPGEREVVVGAGDNGVGGENGIMDGE
ncbi:putative Alcohol dehydrogenase [Coniochaeta hoffmannii]|uniref:Alcohol dehydrogenase n=1 Tax=Coniochaeta hoffmannii TaxID=91930 RepID=A0AA38S1R3_9PEZI|nr:putative Alcohol dehydrogenase [Coniochaeta hoffmannii]